MQHRTIRYSISILLALSTMTGTASAAIIAYDGFDNYTSGTDLDEGSQGSGWTGNWSEETLGDSTIQTPGLIDPNGLVSGGSQALSSQPTGNRGDEGSFITREFTAQSGDVYMSFLFQKGAGVDSADFYNFQLSDGGTGNVDEALGVGIRNLTGNPFFARVGSSNNDNTNTTSINSTSGETFLVVAKFSKDGHSTYNRVDLFLNPNSTTQPISTSATVTDNVTGLTQLSLFSLRNFTPESGDTLSIDELRIGTTFASVVPEPSSFALITGMLSTICVLRRRR